MIIYQVKTKGCRGEKKKVIILLMFFQIRKSFHAITAPSTALVSSRTNRGCGTSISSRDDDHGGESSKEF